MAGLATVVGERLPSPADAQCPWKATIRGGIVLELSYLLPFLGWFVLLPVSIIIGAGATTRALIRSRKQKPAGIKTGDLSIHGDNQMGGTVSAACTYQEVAVKDGSLTWRLLDLEQLRTSG